MQLAWALRPCSAMPRPSTVLRFPRSASGWCCGHTSLPKAEPHSLCFHMGVCVCTCARVWARGTSTQQRDSLAWPWARPQVPSLPACRGLP